MFAGCLLPAVKLPVIGKCVAVRQIQGCHSHTDTHRHAQHRYKRTRLALSHFSKYLTTFHLPGMNLITAVVMALTDSPTDDIFFLKESARLKEIFQNSNLFLCSDNQCVFFFPFANTFLTIRKQD